MVLCLPQVRVVEAMTEDGRGTARARAIVNGTARGTGVSEDKPK